MIRNKNTKIITRATTNQLHEAKSVIRS